MTRLMKTQAGGVDIADGTYLVQLTRLEDTVLDGSAYGKGERPGLRFIFILPEALNEDGEPIELSAVATNEGLSPKTKLWAWYEALTGFQLDVNMDVDLDGMIGCEGLASVVNEPDSTGVKWARIKTLVAAPKAQGAKTSAATKPADPFEGFRKENGHINWELFAGYCKDEGVTPADLARCIQAEKAGPSAVRAWLEGGENRTLVELVLQTQEMKETEADPEDLPFE